jgi:hypothetical protein
VWGGQGGTRTRRECALGRRGRIDRPATAGRALVAVLAISIGACGARGGVAARSCVSSLPACGGANAGEIAFTCSVRDGGRITHLRPALSGPACYNRSRKCTGYADMP